MKPYTVCWAFSGGDTCTAHVYAKSEEYLYAALLSWIIAGYAEVNNDDDFEDVAVHHIFEGHHRNLVGH